MAIPHTFAAGWFASVLVAGVLPTRILAAFPTRIDLFDPKGDRTGYAITEGDRVDFLDGRSNRTRYGRLRDGEVETFDRQENRTGLGRRPAERGG